ncbi:unnamed protein product, partial [Rotaria magnacalcarata]
RWGPDQQQSFDEFKRLLTTYPLFLEYPDLSTPFVLTTDASDDTERKYDTIEQEALAIFWCISELRSYIGDSSFIVETDHK